MTVGTVPEGWNGIDDDVYISIPCVVGEHGVSHIVSMSLSESELDAVTASATGLRAIIDGLVM